MTGDAAVTAVTVSDTVRAHGCTEKTFWRQLLACGMRDISSGIHLLIPLCEIFH